MKNVARLLMADQYSIDWFVQTSVIIIS